MQHGGVEEHERWQKERSNFLDEWEDHVTRIQWSDPVMPQLFICKILSSLGVTQNLSLKVLKGLLRPFI